MTEMIATFVFGLGMGAAAFWIHQHRRQQSQGDPTVPLKEEIGRLKTQLTTTVQAHQDEKDKELNETRRKVREAEDRAYAEGEKRGIERTRQMTIHVRPYIAEKAEGSFIWKKHRVEVGSMYQILIAGAPFSNPVYHMHEVIENVEADRDVLEACKDVAVQSMRAFISAQFGVFPGLVTVDENVVKAKPKKTKMDKLEVE